MRIVSINSEYFNICSRDPELLKGAGRPCVVILKLTFRGQKHDFAVPLRSNIAPNVPKSQYFALPPRPTTKPRYRHGIHFIKLFPIKKKYQLRLRTEGNPYYENIQRIVDSNTAEIVSACQRYLENYENNGKPQYATDLDYLLTALREDDAQIK